MSPYPIEPAEGRGPMRLVLTTYPDRGSAIAAIDDALDRRLAACGNVLDVESRYWWRSKKEAAKEALVLFKTTPKHVAALFRRLAERHPYATPELVEIDVPRVDARYLAWLAQEIEPTARSADRPTRRAAPRGRAARRPGRTRAPRRRRSRGTGTTR